MSTTSRDPIDELGDFATRTAKDARRILAGPDGPLAFALGLGLLAMAEVTIYAEEIGPAMVGNLLATLPLALARKHVAWATGAIVFGVLFAISVDGGTLTLAALVGLVIALYLFASTHRRRWAVLPALPFLFNAIEPFSGDDAGFSGVLLLVVVVAAEALGDSRRQRGEAIAELDETRQAMVDTLQDQAAMGERARIARDMHDVVAHHVSAIAVQAESARLTIEGLPAEGRAHFEAIGQTARDALAEMRRLLGVLREDANAEPTRDPQPSLTGLNELVETARAAGSPVVLTLEGAVDTLPPGVDLCAYRILQEASPTSAGMPPAQRWR
jgi:signal transduction histidine kinase